MKNQSVRVKLPDLHINGNKITIICSSTDDAAFHIWEQLASTNPQIPQSYQDKRIINEINSTSKKLK